jgi:hypothetical protein
MKYQNNVLNSMSKCYDNRSCKYMIIITISLVTIYLWLHNYYIKYIANIHHLTDKELIKQLWDIQILGATDKNYMKLINTKNTDLNFWYIYNYAITKREIIIFFFIKTTKHTNKLNFRSYSINLENHTKKNTNYYIDFSLMDTYKRDETLYVTIEDKLLYMIDLKNNKINIKININDCNIDANIDITYWSTTQISYIHRFWNLRYLPIIGEIIDGQASDFSNEWCIDNPFVGNINSLNYNSNIYNEGTFWTDTYISNNNYIMRDYIWHIINNDEWLIYLLWYCDKKNFNNDCTKVIYIIDVKSNTIVHSGVVVSQLQNIQMTYYSDKLNIGNEKYDDYALHFKSDKIEIDIKSIPDKSHRVEYINNLYLPQKEEFLNITHDSDEEKQYYDEIFKLKYVEYVNFVNFSVKYNDETYSYENKVQIVDACFT